MQGPGTADLDEPGVLYSCFFVANQVPQLYITYCMGLIKLSNELRASEGGSGEWRLSLVLVRLTPKKAKREFKKEKIPPPDNMVEVRTKIPIKATARPTPFPTF